MNGSVVRRVAATCAAALVLGACTTTGVDDGATAAGSGDDDAFPVTIEHALGETTLSEAPDRVATVSWVNADVALALGVVPVGMPTDDWGGNENGSTPWKDEALAELGAAIGTDDAPVQYSEADGIAYEEIAELAPDVILAAYSGLTEEEYDRLTDIAPVVAYPEVPFGTPWQESTRLVGQALGLEAEAEELVTDTEQAVADAVAEHPEVPGKTFVYANLDPATPSVVNVFTSRDNRPRFLEQLGMEQSPAVAEAAEGNDSFFVEWSAERADELQSDVLVAWVPSEEAVDQVQADPLLSQIPAVSAGAVAATSDNTETLALSAASPLSLPWALDEVLPDIAEAARAAEAAGP
ncbi:iron-siderophore ABC transporter substrate-binding protein [Georgenia sp. 10Sc9-8]|uniref:Iron-siderophore ABC transporter substrate-binding protein n=1 Tax=Georgenia halotolerans TaxID=3028317 RepID=A0ABT5U0K8_9MICO|nr:iron-siderophore ABC transporter substrate-binding protein [Georgenia halotolerans]